VKIIAKGYLTFIKKVKSYY